MMKNPYIHCIFHLFDRSISTHFIHLFESIKRWFCTNRTSVWRQWWRRRLATMAQEEAGAGGDWWSRERWGLREFWDEKWNDTGRATIYRFKNITSGSDLKPLLIVLESEPKQFWFKTVVDEGIISSGSKLEPLLISWTFINNDLSLEPLLIYGLAAVQDKPLLIRRII
jgi:hypothetical protein